MTTASEVREQAAAPRRSKTRGRRVGTDPAAGRIKRIDAPQVILVESEAKRANILLQALETHRFRNGDETAVEMPADDDLRRSLLVLAGDVDDCGLAQRGAPAERAPGLRLDSVMVVENAQNLLLEPRVKLDLIDGGRNPGFGDDPLDMFTCEIRDPDRADPPIL
jgi:hypothetical protein